MDCTQNLVYNQTIETTHKEVHQMKTCTHNHSQFFYETENIPDHRSRRFGCCASLLERIKTAFSQSKKPYPGCYPNTASAKPVNR